MSEMNLKSDSLAPSVFNGNSKSRVKDLSLRVRLCFTIWNKTMVEIHTVEGNNPSWNRSVECPVSHGSNGKEEKKRRRSVRGWNYTAP